MTDAREWLTDASHAPQTDAAERTRDALLAVLDLHRPLGSDGKHSNLHTPTCGCDDEALGVTDE